MRAAALVAATLVGGFTACTTGWQAQTEQACVFNQSRDTLTIAGRTVPYWHSRMFYVSHSETLRLAVERRGIGLGTLFIISLVPVNDPKSYDAAVNVHEDSLNWLRASEHSPYFEAYIKR